MKCNFENLSWKISCIWSFWARFCTLNLNFHFFWDFRKITVKRHFFQEKWFVIAAIMILFCISNSVRIPTGSLFVLFPSVLPTTKLQFYVLNWLVSGWLSEHKWPEIFFSLCENSDIRPRYKDYLFNQTFNLDAHNRNIRIHFKQSMSSENP